MNNTYQFLLDLFCYKWKLGGMIFNKEAKQITGILTYNKAASYYHTFLGDRLEYQIQTFIKHFSQNKSPKVIELSLTSVPSIVFAPFTVNGEKHYIMLGHFIIDNDLEWLNFINKYQEFHFIHEIPHFTKNEQDNLIDDVNQFIISLEAMESSNKKITQQNQLKDELEFSFKKIKHSNNLTKREREIIELVLDKGSNSAIANHLNISENTVKSHLTRIYKKLGVQNRNEIIDLFNHTKDA